MPARTAAIIRRTTGEKRTGRSARVVNSILRSTCEELNDVGYAALRVEDVAERAGVNKTTIYRRWPTKPELVVDALRYSFDDYRYQPDTGSLRDDLRESMLHMIKGCKNPIARGALTTLHNCTDPAIKPLAGELLSHSRRDRLELIQRGIDRGELPPTTDPELIADLYSAPILRRLLTFGETVKLKYVEAVLDIVLAGANAVTSGNRNKRAK